MTYRHKLSRRLALLRSSVVVGLVLTAAGCRDTGPLGSPLDSVDSPNDIVALLASPDNPTIAPRQLTPMRAVAVTKSGEQESIEADWMALDGGRLQDSLVGKTVVTFFTADEPGDYRLVSFDRGKRFKDTTQVRVPHQISIVKMYVAPAVAALVAGGSQQFYVYGTTETGDSVPVAANLAEAPGGTASGLVYTAGDTAGTYALRFTQQGGNGSAQAQVEITGAPKSEPPTSEPAPEPAPTEPAPTEPIPTEPLPELPPADGTSPAELPRLSVDTRWPALSGGRISVPAGGDLQGAINAARRGDVIELAPGATYTGNFILPAKAGTDWIVIRTATTLPPEGTRVTPASAAGFARIVTPNNMSAIQTAASRDASYYRIVGVEIASTASATSNLIFLGDRDGTITSAADLPGNIILDRVWAHGNSVQALRRCVALNTRTSAVIDSWLSDCHENGSDSQAIAGWGGPGPFAIINNHLEGAGENLMFGGVDPRIAGLVPSDITIRGNHFFKPLSWKSSGAWTVKNLLEIKNGQRIHIYGNIFENNWSNGQTGFAILFKSVNQSGNCTWCVAQDITFEFNKVINSPGGFNMAAAQGTAVLANGILIANNVLEDVGIRTQTGDLRIFQMLGALRNVTIAHNTAFGENIAVLFDGAPGSGLVFRDNLLTRGQYGIFGSGKGEGNGALAYYAPDALVAGNVIVAAPATQYPTNNAYPSSILSVGLTDYAGGDYELLSTSPYVSSGTGSTTPGADVARLDSILSGVK